MIDEQVTTEMRNKVIANGTMEPTPAPKNTTVKDSFAADVYKRQEYAFPFRYYIMFNIVFSLCFHYTQMVFSHIHYNR